MGFISDVWHKLLNQVQNNNFKYLLPVLQCQHNGRSPYFTESSWRPFFLQRFVHWSCINVFWQGHYEYFRYLSPAVTRVWSLRVWSWIQAGGWSPVRSLERLCSVWKLPHMKTSFESKPLCACCGLTNHLQLSYFAKYDADSFIMASSLFFLGYRLYHSPGFNVLQFSCHCGKL